MGQSFDTPVTFVAFNRPEKTKRTFGQIRALRPTTLLLICDGPRLNRPGEAELCAAVRQIVSEVDWPCIVHQNFSSVNLGCRRRLASGFDWVFSIVEESIFLEDDCLAEPAFFTFCEEMLRRYRDDERVMSIGGINMSGNRFPGNSSFVFSRYVLVWGWASWKRAWRHYDVDLCDWPSAELYRLLEQTTLSAGAAKYFRYALDLVKSGEIDTWDAQWMLAHFRQRGACILPAKNLISNIGFDSSATNTRSRGSRLAGTPTEALTPPYVSPLDMAFDFETDRELERLFYRLFGPNWLRKALRRVLRR